MTLMEILPTQYIMSAGNGIYVANIKYFSWFIILFKTWLKQNNKCVNIQNWGKMYEKQGTFYHSWQLEGMLSFFVVIWSFLILFDGRLMS